MLFNHTSDTTLDKITKKNIDELLELSTAVSKLAILTQYWSQKRYSKCASPDLTHAADCGDDDDDDATEQCAMHNDVRVNAATPTANAAIKFEVRQNQIFKPSPESDLFHFIESVHFLL